MPELIIFADSRAFIHLFRGVIVKCNNFEVVRCVTPDYTGEPDQETVLRCGRKLYELNDRPVFVTRGEHGVIAFDKSGANSAAGLKVPGPFDIVGAGDSASSGIVLALTLGASPLEAAELANIVASIVIQQIGVTGFSTPEQVLKRHREYGV
jgi:sugar/nucleoside kinase (ribokinase family)